MIYERPILCDPDPKLRKKARRVPKTLLRSELFQQTLDDLAATRRRVNGVGLSGVQIGFPYRVFVIGDDKQDWCFINATAYAQGPREWMEEACLSKPGFICEMHRYKQVAVRGWDRKGKPVAAMLSDAASQCCQHEIDHAGGFLIGDVPAMSRLPQHRTPEGARIYLPA